MNNKTIKVVSILSPFKVVINVGEKHGIVNGQRILIYGLTKDPVIDPDTGEYLGHIEIVRGIGQVSHVQERISTVDCIEKETKGRRIVRDKMGGFSALMGHSPEETIYENNIKPFDGVQISDYARPL